MTLRQRLRWLFEAWSGGSVLDDWRRALSTRALHEVAATKIPVPNLVAKAEGLLVVFSTLPRGQQGTGTEITITRTGGRAFPLSLSHESMWTAWNKRHGHREVEVGEPGFDQAFYVQGDTGHVLAVLDAATRREIDRLAGQAGLVIAFDKFSAGLGSADEPTLPALLPRIFDLAKRLAEEVDVVARLATNATTDPIAGVRLRNVVVLACDHARDPEAHEALRTASLDVVPEIRLRAAIGLGDEGFPVLEQLAADTEIPDECSAYAVAAIEGRLPGEPLLHTLHASLRARRIETAAACIAALAMNPSEDALTAFRKILSIEHGRLAVAAAQALGARESAPAEEALRSVLAGDSGPDVRLAATDSLGRIGTVASVPTLGGCGRRFSGERALQRAVRQAIAEIQSRRVGAARGQLSLANPTAGGLTLIEGSGQLSLVGDEKRRAAESGAVAGS